LQNTVSFIWGTFAKETYNFEEPTNGSQPIGILTVRVISNSDSDGEYLLTVGIMTTVGTFSE